MSRKALVSLAILSFILACPSCVGIAETSSDSVSKDIVNTRELDDQYYFNQSTYKVEGKKFHKTPKNEAPATFEATVRFEMPQSVCSATVIGERTILTAAHCISVGKIAKINGEVVFIEKIITDKSDHSFVVFDKNTKFTKIALLALAPRVGDDVFYWGNPDGMENILRKGYVAQKYPDGSMLIDSNSWKGDSGAGIFNKDGRLIGVVSIIVGKSDLATNGMGYKFMGAFSYTFTKEQIVEAGIKYACESCQLIKL